MPKQKSHFKDDDNFTTLEKQQQANLKKRKRCEAKRRWRSFPENRKRELERLQERRRQKKSSKSATKTSNIEKNPICCEPLDLSLKFEKYLNAYQDEPFIEDDVSEFQIMEKYPEEKYQSLVRQCNSGQFDFLMHMLYYFRRCDDNCEPLDIFVQGAAGTGKSVLIQVLYQTLIRLPSFSKENSVIKLAPTGKGALHITGDTLHHALGLQLNESKCIRRMREETRKKYTEMYAHLRVIIIDEISMLGLKLLSRLNRRLREIRGVKNKRYGNLHVIKFGDLRQLPPVKDAYMFSSDLWWCSNTQFYELDEIMRQKNEKEYLELLDDLANGPLQPEHVQFLASRERPFECLPRESVILCYSNKEVDDYNAKRLSMLPSQMIQCNAYDTVLSDKPKKLLAG